MTSSEVVSGVGARYACVFPLDTTTGLPLPAVTTAVPAQGTLVQGIKTMAVTDPEPQRITHYGDDLAFAQDSLPATTVGSFNITTAKSNLILDSMVEGNKVVTIDDVVLRGVNTDRKGQEPLVLFMGFRQALDTKRGSANFGKLRQWQIRLYPSTRITPQSQSFEQSATDKSYSCTPTPVSQAPWGQMYNEATWGNNQAEALDLTVSYQPRINTWRGNGTLTAFQLSHPPVDSTYLHVWVNGTLQTPSAVDISTTNPAFTLTSAANTNNNLIFALIETNSPGIS
jgi:hypothetical protein